MAKKFYSFETSFKSLTDELKYYLTGEGIYFEASGGPGFYHLEIFTNAAGAEKINAFIDTMTITEA